MRQLALLILMAAATNACSGDDVRDTPPTCTEDPTQERCKPPPECTQGTVRGRICAPDRTTGVSGAELVATGSCGDVPFDSRATADDAGKFTITLPAGKRRILARSGSFERVYEANVVPGTVTDLPADALCFDRTSARIAAVTGSGDQIEVLLSQLGFEVTTYDGKGDAFYQSGGGLELLSSKDKLSKYDVVFIDCAAGRRNGKLDVAGKQNQVGDALRNFVESGGSLYASDWAFLYVYLAFDDIKWKLLSGDVTLPFDTNRLMGYAPQTIAATVLDDPLAAYLGKNTVSVTFPRGGGASSQHWGLVSSVSDGVSVLIRGDAKLCDGAKPCDNDDGVANNTPLAVQLDLTPGTPGGAVIYTSFHNIAQETKDVGEILKYLIFKL